MVSVSQPGVPGSQSPKPAVQLETSHAPSMQTGVPPSDGHALPQALQCSGLTSRFASQPSLGFALQSAKSVAHASSWQTPPTQSAVALANPQLIPQEPQLSTSVSIGCSQPFSLTLSQFSHPGSHTSMEHVPATHLVVA